jgi:endogenous inhibitor of DNA gyrase (YacG/DUF329 family)
MSPEVQPTGSAGRGARMTLALEQQYRRALIELEVRRRFAFIKRRIHKAPPKKTCPMCGVVLQNQQRTFCSKKCVCRYMSAQLARPESYQQRAERRQNRLVTIHCKTCGRDMGRRKPGSVTYCSRECVGKDPDIRRSKSEQRRLKWQDPAYRKQMADRARARNADPNNRFGNARRHG